ncbi:MAG: glycosyltransferase family 39 protein [Clostridiales bacterium]|nr:glycosyltransferase family 39 protein [Clostridiales bacterium]
MSDNTLTQKSPRSSFSSSIVKNKENILAFLVSGLFALIFAFESCINPWLKIEAWTDSSVFKTVALMMERGYMPYRDSFDHKGPVLYFINFLGNKIDLYSGVLLIEVIAITITFFVMYKISRLSCGIIASLVTTLTASSLLFAYYESGNYSEEFAMPCIAIALYIFIDYLLNNKISKLRLIASGICLGTVLMLRPNMISVWIVYCVLILVVLLIKKEFKKLGGFVSFFFIGVAVVIVPILIWLIAKDDLEYFINDYIIFNMKYISSGGDRNLFYTKWGAFFKFARSSIYVIAFVSILFHLKQKKVLNISYLIYLVFTVMLMVMSGEQYGHYGMILVPAVVYPISLAFSTVEKIKEIEISRAIIILASLYLFSAAIAPEWIETISTIPEIFEKRNEDHFDEDTRDIINIIEMNTDKDDKISVYGNWDLLYVTTNRAHATRYSYQFPVGQVMPEIMDEYFKSLKNEKPSIIVVQNGYYDEDIQTFLEKNAYEMIYSSNPDNPEASHMVFSR